VFQHFALLPHLTVLGNVAFPLEIQGIARRARETKALEMIELVGLKGRERYYPRELSGGQQQRVGIARSLAVEPEIWFLDEPFSALDPLIRTRLQDELLELQEKLHRTIIFVSHDLDEAFKIGNRIALMEGGRIVQCGTAREIIANPVSDYVADFVAHMNPLGVLRASDIMEPGPVRAPNAPEVDPEAPVRDVMERLREVPALAVTEGGRTLGRITREGVIGRLLDPRG
jgi:glycine betaine/proline transport system ATP-binding protein